jgi:hypothetical protein
LTPEQKRAYIAKLLAENPKQSNRQVAQRTGTDHNTVGAVRADLEATGELPQSDRTEGRDGKARPVRRKVRPTMPVGRHGKPAPTPEREPDKPAPTPKREPDKVHYRQITEADASKIVHLLKECSKELKKPDIYCARTLVQQNVFLIQQALERNGIK